MQAIAGMLSEATTYPMEVVRRRMQMSGVHVHAAAATSGALAGPCSHYEAPSLLQLCPSLAHCTVCPAGFGSLLPGAMAAGAADHFTRTVQGLIQEQGMQGFYAGGCRALSRT